MKRVTPACKLFLWSLIRKYKFFCSIGKLNEDGSFYYDDLRFSKELGVSDKTIMRARRFLGDSGKIRFELGKYKHRATKYWILSMPDKKSPSNLSLMPDKISQKGCQLSFKANQNVTPVNKNKILSINCSDCFYYKQKIGCCKQGKIFYYPPYINASQCPDFSKRTETF